MGKGGGGESAVMPPAGKSAKETNETPCQRYQGTPNLREEVIACWAHDAANHADEHHPEADHLRHLVRLAGLLD